MHQDPNEVDCDEPATDSRSNADWIEVVTRAQRRRERKPNPAVGLTAQPTTTKPSLTPKFAPRPAPLPRDDYKLVLRPQGGLKIAQLDLAEVSLALLNAIQSTWRQTNLRVRYDMVQNTATISTPSAEAAKALSQVKQIRINNVAYPVQLYGLAPDHSVKGIIRGAPLRFSERELLDNMYVPNHEIYACRRLGNSNIVVVTFAGNKVPYYVTLFGSEYPCSLYKKTVPVCDACHELGHRATACPQPNTPVCHQCGVKDPKPEHDCKALCSLCGGAHLTANKGCPKRFREPFILRQRQFERKRTEERASRVDHLALQADQQASQQGHPASQPHQRASQVNHQSQRGRPRYRSRTASARRRGNSSTRSKSGSRNRAPKTGNDEKQVSWARVVSPTARRDPTPTPPKNTHSYACQECSTFKAQLAQQQTIIASLQKRLAELESSRYDSLPDKRKRPSRTAGANSNAMDTAPAVPSAQGECASFSPQAEGEAIGQNKASSENTTDPFSQQTQSQGGTTSLEDLLKALQTQIQTQTDQINQQLQALSAQVAQNGVQINQVVGRVDQLGTRIDRLEGRMETVETNSLRRRQAPYSRPPASESKDLVSFPDEYTTK